MFGQTGMGGMPTGASITPPPPAPGATNTMMGGMPNGGNAMSLIFEAMRNPSGTAQQMAANGITPEQFQNAMSNQQKLGSTMQPGKMDPGADQKTMNTLMGGMPKPLWRGEDQASPATKPSLGSLIGGSRAEETGSRLAVTPDNYVEKATPDNFITLDTLAQFFKSENANGRAGMTGEYLGNNPQMVAGAQMQPPIAPPVLPQPVAATGVTQPSPITPQAATGLTTPTIPPSIAATGMTQPEPGGNNVLIGRNGNPVPTIGENYKPSGVMGGAGGTAPNLTGNEIYDGFMGAIRSGGVTNPNALAAIAATGKSESGFNAGNAYGSWDDVGMPAGGVMSWRADRLNNMRAFVKANGGDPNKPSPELQGKFFMQENPQLIQALNNAKTPEEAMTLMNNAWKFKGYDQPGTGEAARRISLARNMASQFANGGNPDIGKAGSAAGPLGGPGVVSNQAPSNSGTTAADIAAALQTAGGGEDGWGKLDMNLPQAPSPIAPRPGEYNPDANAIKLMLMMLSPQGMQQIPSLSAMMGRA